MSRMQAAGHAAIAAATLHAGSGDLEAFKATYQTMLAGILANGQDPAGEIQAAPREQPHYPGPVTQAMVQAQQNLAQGGISATPVEFKNDNERWQDALINNPGNWYNNVGDPQATSGGGRGPDFRHKQNKDEVIFLNGKYGSAPDWVFEKLGLPVPGQAPQAPAQQQVPTGPAPF